ncbi:wax ester/triacylglycerol synthase family O-acyltransferase [Trujillonella humicola]|uniref:wax ester/triacylglycerol synthase family O-acyltransferase n=1 Tax=Trujillonella humicola TaxID=3383699 RepID=UPI0039057A88
MAGLDRLADRELAGMEAIFVKGDAEIRSRSTVLAVFPLARTPDFADVLTAFDRGSRLARRLRQRVVAPVVPISRPYWIVDPDFDLEYHVRHVRLPHGGGRQALLDAAERIGQVPVDPARPLWEATLVDGLDDGSAAILLKFHHAITDGQGGTRMLRALFTDEHAVDAGALPPAPGVEDVTALELTRQRIGHLPLELTAGALGTARGVASAALRGLRSPRSTVSGALDYARSARRTVAPGPEPSPLLRRRGIRRAYRSLELPLADLRRAAKALGGSVNDAYVAVLSGGLGRYHERLGSPIDEVPIAMPVSIRRPDDPVDVNRFTGIRLAAPAGTTDLAERVRLIGARVGAARSEPAVDAMSTLAPAASYLPLWLTEGIAGAQQRRTDLQASNIPGWPEEVHMAGVPVTGAFSFGPLAGTAVMVVMTTYAGRCCIGVNMDAQAVSDPDLLHTSLQEAFDELVRAGEQR